MTAQRRVKLFRNGRNQAVRIPREFEMPGDEAILRREGERLILEPPPHRSLVAVLADLEPLEEEFPPIAELTLVTDNEREFTRIAELPVENWLR